MTKQGFFPHHYLCISRVGRVLSVLPAVGVQYLIHQPHCRWCHPPGPQWARDQCQHPHEERGGWRGGWEKARECFWLGMPHPAAISFCLPSTQLKRAKPPLPFPKTAEAAGLQSELLDRCCCAFLSAGRCSGDQASSLDVVAASHLLTSLSSLAAQAEAAVVLGYSRAKTPAPVSTGLQELGQWWWSWGSSGGAACWCSECCLVRQAFPLHVHFT